MPDLAQVRLRDYRPVPSLSAPVHRVERACAPAIDAHTHLGRWLTGGAWAVPSAAGLVELMDSCNVAGVVNMDGRWGAELEANLDRYDRRYPGRFATFCHVDWAALADGEPGLLPASLADSVARGARGLKVWKDLGLHVRDGRGRLVLPDDPRLSPNFTIDIAERIAELGRQPRRTRALIMRHPGRVLFATDSLPPARETYEIYFRFLETGDDYFSYSPQDPPPTGRWYISALDLPAETLRLVYSENARALIPGLGAGL